MRLTTSLILLLQTFYSFAQTPSDYKFQSIGIAQGASKISTHTATHGYLAIIIQTTLYWCSLNINNKYTQQKIKCQINFF